MSLTLAAQANELEEALQEPPPEIGKAAPTTVELIRGVVDADTGEWQTTATVREMTGEDEEELARLSTKEDLSYAEYTSVLLSRAVESVGTLRVSADPSILDNLIVGDRDLLFLGVVKATYGNVRTFIVNCPACQGSSDVMVNLDRDFPVRQPVDDPRKTRSVTLRDGKDAQVRYPTGKDAQAIAEAGDNLAVQNTAIIVQCVVWDDDRTDVVKKQWARELSIADRRLLVSAIVDSQPGPTLEEVEAPCAHCDETVTMVLDWAYLLFG
jgi:hypothetical protein|tara:strand:- start:1367 stop:2170 length:804 start_codon:yes stop_codon:yes gene_type:complete